VIKILIIEDDEYVRLSLQDLLEENEFEVIAVSNGFQGVETARTLLPDLIICDIMMPGLDGLQVLRILSQNIKTAVIPFVFLTALSEMSDLRKAMALGANDYIIKPYDAPALLDTIKTRLKKVEAFKNSVQKRNFNRRGGKIHESPSKDLLFLENQNDAGFYKIEEIIYIKAENVCSRVFTKDLKNIIIRRTLKQWQDILPGNFLRIRRSVIININYAAKTEKISSRMYKVTMQNTGEEFSIGQNYIHQIKKYKNPG